MKFLFKWFSKKLREANEEIAQTMSVEDYPNVKKNTINKAIELNSRTSIRFNVYKADGGYIVETCSSDRSLTDTGNSLYIITSDQDFSERLAHIITFDALKR